MLVNGSGSYYFPDIFQPYVAGKAIYDLFPHLLATAAEDMLGELPIGVKPRNGVNRFGESTGAGPALSQLFPEDDQ